jgi:predicted DNA-binding transcriptional regulator YafY
MEDSMTEEVTFTYKNYRGETSVRRVRPIRMSFESNEYHSERQWMIHGFDIDKDDDRTFTMADITDWQPAPAVTNGERS